MTVASTTNRKEYAMDAVTTSFATSPVVFYDTSDLVVQVVTEATGAATTLTENTHYTVTGGDGSTGTVNTAGGTSPYGAGSSAYTLVIVRTLPLTQPADLVQNDGSDAEVQERAFDRLTMMVQQQDEELGRALKVSASEGEQDAIVVTGKAGYYLRRNVAGDAFELAVGDANTSTFTQSGTGAVERSVTAKLGEVISVTDFGAVGDSTTDDTAAFQAAIDYAESIGGGTVVVPRNAVAGNYYRLSGADGWLVMKDNVQLVGEGYGSFIKNDLQTQVTAGDQCCITWGAYSGSVANRQISDETFYACGNITPAERVITVTTAAEAANFAAGNVVFIRNNTSEGGFYTYSDVNEVESVDTGTGVVTLKFPHYGVATTVYMAKSSGTLTDIFGNPIKMRKNTRIANLRIENYYNANQGVFVHGGLFNSIIENIWLDASNAFSFNACYRSTIRRIRGVVSQKVIDEAYYSGFNLYDDMQIEQGKTPTSTDPKAVFGQYTHDSRISRSRINSGAITDQWVMRIGRASRIKVNDVELVGYGLTGSTAVLSLDGNGAGTNGPDGCTLDNVRVYCASPTNAVLYDNAAEDTPSEVNTIRGLRVVGTPTNGLSITASSKKLVVDSSVMPALKIANASTDNTVILRNNSTLTQNYPVREGQVTTLNTKGADTVAKTYAIAQNACSATGGWRVRASGTATTAAGAGTRRLQLKMGSVSLRTLNLETSMAGKGLSIDAVIYNTAINAQVISGRYLIGDATGPNSTELLSVATPTGTDFSAGSGDITLVYQLDAADTSIVLREWSVEPFGHDQA